MKTLLLLLLVAVPAIPGDEKRPYDAIKGEHVKLGMEGSEKLILFYSKTNFKQILGEPPRKSKYVSPIEDREGENNEYPGLTIITTGPNYSDIFELTGGPFYWQTPKGIKVKIGKSISVLEKEFPRSYKSRQNGSMRVIIGDYSDEDYGLMVEIEYHVTSRLIKKISLFGPCC